MRLCKQVGKRGVRGGLVAFVSRPRKVSSPILSGNCSSRLDKGSPKNIQSTPNSVTAGVPGC